MRKGLGHFALLPAGSTFQWLDGPRLVDMDDGVELVG
jgi:hypothetical protein